MATMSRAMGCPVLVRIWATPVGAQLASARQAIRSQVQGFYRDERDHRWPDVLDHFWVGKISARWAAPTSNPTWVGAHPVARDSGCVTGDHTMHALSIALIDDRWARVFATPCVGEPSDELWMLRVGEDWRIARMIRGS